MSIPRTLSSALRPNGTHGNLPLAEPKCTHPTSGRAGHVVSYATWMAYDPATYNPRTSQGEPTMSFLTRIKWCATPPTPLPTQKNRSGCKAAEWVGGGVREGAWRRKMAGEITFGTNYPPLSGPASRSLREGMTAARLNPTDSVCCHRLW